MEDPVRTVDLRKPPDGMSEIRLRRNDCIVSIWLPAEAAAVAGAMTALAKAGYDFWREGT